MKKEKILKIVILAVVLLIPIIYSFFYLKSYWNPYGDLTGLKIAVVNLDDGENNENQGAEFLKSLQDDGTFDICPVSLDEANEGMKVALKQIQDGTFKKQFADENATDGANLKEMRAAEGRKEIEIVGERLRKACGLQKDD